MDMGGEAFGSARTSIALSAMPVRRVSPKVAEMNCQTDGFLFAEQLVSNRSTNEV